MSALPPVEMRPFDSRGWRVAAVVIAVAALGWLGLGFLVGVNADEEDYRFVIPSTLLAARALMHGGFAFWTSDFALGVPQPFAQSLWMHPLMPLLNVLSVSRWVALFYGLQLVVAGVGVWGVARRAGASSLSAGMAVATYVLASPAQNYALTDFWPSLWMVYSTAPLLLLALLGLLEADSMRSRLKGACAAGLVAGLIGTNGHQGNYIVYVVPMVAFLALHVRRIARDWPWWLLAAGIAALVTAPAIYHLWIETRLAPGILTRPNYPATQTAAELWDGFVRPFGAHAGNWEPAMRERGTRILFFGAPATVLAVFYGVIVRKRVDLVCGATTSLLLLNLPIVGAIRLISALHMFRDPLILFATPCAALAVDWIAARSEVHRRLAVVLVGAQLVVLGAATWPFIEHNLDDINGAPSASTSAGVPPLAAWLRSRVQPSGGRVYYSEAVDAAANNGALQHAGIGRNAMFYLGVPVLDAAIKGVAIDVLAPNDASMRIKGQSTVPLDTMLMDVAGVRWVLALDGEPVASSLIARDRHMAGDLPLVLYETPSARGAVFVDPRVRDLRLPAIPGCAHDRLLCRDFSSLAALVDRTAARVVRHDSAIEIDFPGAAEPRWMLVGEMFRPEWQADAGEKTVEPLVGGLIGVRVPGGVTHVTLRYRPIVRTVLGLVSWGSMAVAALLSVA